MKFIVVTIRSGGDSDPRRMIYPAIYDAIAVDKNRQGPIKYNGGIKRGGATAECLIYMTDRLANLYVTDPDIREITQAEADAWLATNPELDGLPEEIVNDPNRLTAIIAKTAAGAPLSAEDQAAVDPDNPMPGIVRRTRNTAGYYGV